jgi:hypothetical protein
MTARTLISRLDDVFESDLVCARRQRVASRPAAEARN